MSVHDLMASRGGDFTPKEREALQHLPPMPSVPPVRVPSMPVAGLGDLGMLRRAFIEAGDHMGVRSLRVPHVEALGKPLQERLAACDTLLGKHKIYPHAWAMFRLIGLRKYEAALTMSAVWQPQKLSDKKQRGHFRRWAQNQFHGTRMSTAHRDLLARWEACVTEAVQQLGGGGAPEVRAIVARHFPSPDTYAALVERARVAVLVETAALSKAAARGEWIW